MKSQMVKLPVVLTGRCLATGVVITFALINCWFIYISILPHSPRIPSLSTNPDLSSDTNSAKATDLPSSLPPPPQDDSIKSATPAVQINESTISPGVCDIFVGRWVPDARPPLYTNETCKYIQPSQNCMMNGRPDRGYLNWRWKPNGCELDYLDPAEFLEFMRNKKLVFIGDSLARNHMQALLCTLAQVEEPEKVYFDTKDKEMRWGFTSYNFTLNHLWSPFLSHHEFIDEIYHIHLDVPEDVWWSQVHDYDVAIMSSGYWWFRPSVYYMNKTMLGCNPRSHLNCTIFEVLPAYRLAHQNMLKLMMESFKGITLLRTITVDHFEYGSWNTGGLCNRTEPFSATDPPELPWMSNEMNTIQADAFKQTMEAGGGEGWRLKLLNLTYSTFMRPDGHPNTYRIQPAYEHPQNDCLHWCLPGPIDTWNQFAWHTLRQLELKSKGGSGRPLLRHFNKLGRP